MGDPKLYISSVSPTCKRVFVVATLKKIKHERIEIDIAQKVRPEEFTRISPYGKVPVVEHDGRVVFESTVINEYLEEVFPQPRLLPSDPGERAYARSWIKYADSGLQDLDARMVHTVRDASDKRAICAQLLANLAYLDRELQSKERFFLGADLSLVDAALAPTLRLVPIWSKLVDDKLWDSYTNVRAYLDRLCNHPAIQASVLDTPKEVYEGFFKAVLIDGLTVP
jgi:glutathione S-transferase